MKSRIILIIGPIFEGLKPWLVRNQAIVGMPALYNLLIRLPRKGWNVHYIAVDTAGDFVKHKTKKRLRGIHVYLYHQPLPTLWHRFKKIVPSFGSIGSLLDYLVSIGRVAKIVNRVHPKIIYASGGYCIAAYVLSVMKDIPNVTRVFGTLLTPYIPTKWLWLRKPIEGLAFKIPAKFWIITDDGTQADTVADFFRIPQNKRVFWRNGVNLSSYLNGFDGKQFKKHLGISESQLIFLSTSRLDSWKRVDRIIYALPEVTETFKNIRLLIVGNGREKDNLKGLASSLNLNNYVQWISQVPHSEIPKYLSICDVFLSCYDYSNIGNTLLEAMVCGKCIIALNAGDTAKIIHHWSNGILINPDDSHNQLVYYMKYLIIHEEVRKNLGMRAQQYALKEFQSWEQRINKEIRLLASIINSKTYEKVIQQ